MSISLGLKNYKHVVVLTGAGISVASGIRSFRGEHGLCGEMNAEELSSVEMLNRNPMAVHRFYGGLREAAAHAQPNEAHLALARAEADRQPGTTFSVITQNLDGLHQRAGSRVVHELHGSVFETRCSRTECSFKPIRSLEPAPHAAETCPVCGASLRPGVTLFGEMVPALPAWEAKRALRDVDLFIAVGTSGVVDPAARFVRSAVYACARTVYVNTAPLTRDHDYFHESYIGKAEVILPQLLA